MSATQLGVGIVFLSMIGSAALQVVLPEAQPFTINALTYSNGIVTQDRTIATDQPAFYAQWAVTVENVDTGDSLRQCEGFGANAYPPGRKAVSFTLPDWTGRPGCTLESIPAGRYALRGSWRWGEHSAALKSSVFEVTK